MARFGAILAAAAIVALTAVAGSAQTRPVAAGLLAARLPLGGIQGTVLDQRGIPLAGAIVSALGGPMPGMAITDTHGRFLIDSLPAGEYMLRVHLTGFVSARYDRVRVDSARQSVEAIRLERSEADALGSRPILTAGVAVPSGDDPSAGGDDHSEVAWRLRHLKRSVLKDDGSVVSIVDAAAGQTIPDATGSVFGRAFDDAAAIATAATAFFADTPFSGEVNLLTTSALGEPLFGSNYLSHGIAYVSIGAPVASGRWDVRASLSQSDLAAWILAGSYSSHAVTNHDYGFGVSYGTQQYVNHDELPLPTGTAADSSHAAGELYGSDRWTISPAVALEYSARYGRYDYLPSQGLFSPRLSVALTPLSNTHVTGTVAEQMLAPGAEEFVAPTMVGPWLPPERTFAPLEGETLQVERARLLDLGIDHEFNGAYVFGVRRFQQNVDNQMAVLFGLPIDGGPETPGHYFVANTGAVAADGWAVRLATDPSQRVRGSIDYSVTRTHWLARGDSDAIAAAAPDAVRPTTERIHDLTTSVETVIPQTATRVFVLYKIDAGLERTNEAARSGVDYRFDVQVNQALPFMPFGASRWEVLVGLRNLFRDPTQAGSIYDELLVIRPPKRVIGGVLVKF
jgi:hypothetical protein